MTVYSDRFVRIGSVSTSGKTVFQFPGRTVACTFLNETGRDIGLRLSHDGWDSSPSIVGLDVVKAGDRVRLVFHGVREPIVWTATPFVIVTGDNSSAYGQVNTSGAVIVKFGDDKGDPFTRIKNGSHESTPPVTDVEVGEGGEEGFTIKNDTDLTIRVYLRGPSTKDVTLVPGESHKLTLEPGEYELAAEVTGAAQVQVRPFYGHEHVASGHAYGIAFRLQK
jgi:hypothetical protein